MASALFRGALLTVALTKAGASRKEKLDELERRVAAVVLAYYAAAVRRARESVEKTLTAGTVSLSENDVSNILRAVERELADEDGEWLQAALGTAPALAGAVYSATRGAGEDFEPDARDAALAAALAREQAEHLRNFYKNRMEATLLALLLAALEKDSREAQVAEVLRVLDERLSPGESKLTPGARSAPEVYLLGLLAVARVRGDALGTLARLGHSGVAYYRLVATIDDRTTDICLYLDGRVFPVNAALEMADAYGRGDPSGWLPYASLSALGAGDDRDDPASQAVLVEAGVLFPPFHYNCRTEVEPA